MCHTGPGCLSRKRARLSSRRARLRGVLAPRRPPLLRSIRRPADRTCHPRRQVFHFAIAMWAFSFFGTPTSKLLTPGFGAFMRRVTARLEPVWRDASGLPPDLVRVGGGGGRG